MQASAPVGWLFYLAAQMNARRMSMNRVDDNLAGSEANLPRRRKALSPDDYVSGVLAGDRGVLARAITLVESTSPLHEAQAQEVLQRLLPHTGRAQRIGITGVPGVGKSTFIERFGCYLIEQGRKLAVLAIDPTSKKSGGSILGDKTRMEKLSQQPQAFIRPSPAGNNLGGVARRTRETLLLCEAAGFDTVLVETVGVGQSETALRSMVDFFLLLLLPGAGDELQGIKKGIIEMADAVLINKADGDNRLRAEQARAEQQNALHYLTGATSGWITQVALCSGLTGEGIPEAWELIQSFFRQFEPAGVIAKRRQQQSLEWLSSLINDELLRRFYHDSRVKGRLSQLQQLVLRGDLTAVRAAQELLEGYGEVKE
jgi:LAO/AO transport system kinase